MKNLVSIIVPVYNVERYLEKCINSLINQTYRNIEIILVDDGSKDKSGIICDEYKKKDKRIKVIHQENQGLSCARNAGIENSSGDWLYFIDSDDWVDNDIINVLLNLSVKYESDIVSCNSCDVLADGSILYKRNDSGKIYSYEDEEIINGFVDSNRFIRFEVWNKLWKKSLIGNIRFKKGQVSEDIYFDRVLFAKCNKIIHIDETHHFYVKERPGNTNSSFKLKRLSIFDEYKDWINELRKKKFNKSIVIVAAMACDTAAGLFYQANKTNQEKKVLEMLSENFNYFIKFVNKSVYCWKRIRIFKFNRYLYCLLSGIYKKCRSWL